MYLCDFAGASTNSFFIPIFFSIYVSSKVNYNILQGFTDKEYRKRRKEIAEIAFDFR